MMAGSQQKMSKSILPLRKSLFKKADVFTNFPLFSSWRVGRKVTDKGAGHQVKMLKE